MCCVVLSTDSITEKKKGIESSWPERAYKTKRLQWRWNMGIFERRVSDVREEN